MEAITLSEPVLVIMNDYEKVFENRVRQAIEVNQKLNVPMVKTVRINSGSYRPYCMAYKVIGDVCEIDFYAAARVMGFEHSIDDIAEAISSTLNLPTKNEL
jgi:cobalamin biosynthesis Co2+ chelatase CbiK